MDDTLASSVTDFVGQKVSVLWQTLLATIYNGFKMFTSKMGHIQLSMLRAISNLTENKAQL